MNNFDVPSILRSKRETCKRKQVVSGKVNLTCDEDLTEAFEQWEREAEEKRNAEPIVLTQEEQEAAFQELLARARAILYPKPEDLSAPAVQSSPKTNSETVYEHAQAILNAKNFNSENYGVSVSPIKVSDTEITRLGKSAGNAGLRLCQDWEESPTKIEAAIELVNGYYQKLSF